MFTLGRLSLSAVLLGAVVLALGATVGSAQLESCADLLDHPPLAGNPAVVSATSVPATTAGRAYCNVQVVWSDPALRGAAGGYADPYPEQNTYQWIRVGVALPLNTNEGDAAWGGRLILTAGGGAQGSVPGLTGFIQMNPAAIGAGSDSGHGTVESGPGDTWGVVQGEGLNHGKVEDWAGGRSNYVAVRLAKQLAETYYGRSAERTYWTGFSGGGHMGWAQALFHPEEYDGFLINSPANHWQKFRLADSWDEIVRKKVAQQTSAITAGQMNAVNAAVRAACDVIPDVDDVQDNIIADPRFCTWSARNNICGAEGAPTAPDCLNEIQADGIDRGWDGPRNRHGKRIWPAYDRGINLGTSTATVGFSTSQVLRWTMFDNTFPASNLYADQESIDLAAAAGVDVSRAITYEDAALLGSQRTADFTDADFPTLLTKAHDLGIKIIVTHGTADPLIHWRNALDFYTRGAAQFGTGTPDYDALHPWYRFFPVPGLGHAPVNALPQLIDWVENGVVPDRIERTTGFRVLCPFPQRAIYIGPDGGSTTDPSNFECGGNLQTKETICLGLRTPYKQETSDELQAYGRYNPSTCTGTSKGPGG
jgi:Tannase and feruloyl esterase